MGSYLIPAGLNFCGKVKPSPGLPYCGGRGTTIYLEIGVIAAFLLEQMQCECSCEPEALHFEPLLLNPMVCFPLRSVLHSYRGGPL